MVTTCWCLAALGSRSVRVMATTSMSATWSTSDGPCSAVEGRNRIAYMDRYPVKPWLGAVPSSALLSLEDACVPNSLLSPAWAVLSAMTALDTGCNNRAVFNPPDFFSVLKTPVAKSLMKPYIDQPCSSECILHSGDKQLDNLSWKSTRFSCAIQQRSTNVVSSAGNGWAGLVRDNPSLSRNWTRWLHETLSSPTFLWTW